MFIVVQLGLLALLLSADCGGAAVIKVSIRFTVLTVYSTLLYCNKGVPWIYCTDNVLSCTQLL